MTDLVVRTVPGDQLARHVWTVYTYWGGVGGALRPVETRQDYPDWPAARGRALRDACLNGVYYVTVCGPGYVVVGDWDRYTNRWREYPRSLAVVGVKP